jgi:hypothetical protein
LGAFLDLLRDFKQNGPNFIDESWPNSSRFIANFIAMKLASALFSPQKTKNIAKLKKFLETSRDKCLKEAPAWDSCSLTAKLAAESTWSLKEVMASGAQLRLAWYIFRI